MHNEELHDVYSSTNNVQLKKSKCVRYLGACGGNGVEDKAFKNVVEKPEGKRPLGRPARG
jgi:hypothetical protein